MTLVPNHRQPLSGNKSYFLLLLLTGFLLFGCKTSQKAQDRYRQPDVVIDPSKRPSDPPPVPDIPQPDKPKDNKLPKEKSLKPVNVALLLPLFLDTVRYQNYDVVPPRPVDSRAKMGLEFYKGVLLAKEDLEYADVRMNLKVFDTENSDFLVTNHLRDAFMDSVDLVIGPVYNSNLRIAANWAKEKQIPLVSPLSPAEEITSENPWFIQMNPVLEVHIENLFAHLLKRHAGKNFIVVYEEDATGLSQISSVQQFYNQYSEKTGQRLPALQTLAFQYRESEDKVYMRKEDKVTDLKASLNLKEPNIIFLPTFNESFILNMLRQLTAYSEEGFEIILAGMPGWIKFKNMRFDQLEKLQYHFSDSYYVEDSLPAFQAFAARCFERFASWPDEFTVKGYDQMLALGKLLYRNQTAFRENLLKYPIETLHTQIRFEPVVSSPKNKNTESATPDRIENRSTNILLLHQFRLFKLN